MHYALRLQARFENIILSKSRVVLPTLIGSLDNPFFMDVKLAILKSFLPRIQFLQVDSLISKITVLVENASTPDGIMVCNINPFMVACQILYIS